MRKYRLGYDYLFVAKEPFEWNGRLIGSLSISVLFQSNQLIRRKE